MSSNWTDGEVFKLTEQWEEDGIQEQLEGARVREAVRCVIESRSEKGGEQCRSKVKKLRQEYKKIKGRHNLTGRGEQCGNSTLA